MAADVIIGSTTSDIHNCPSPPRLRSDVGDTFPVVTILLPQRKMDGRYVARLRNDEMSGSRSF